VDCCGSQTRGPLEWYPNIVDQTSKQIDFSDFQS
jgi:hypothetical protein